MDLGAIFLLVAVIILVALYVARPFAGRQRSVTGHEKALSTLLAERDRVLTALQELDFDYSLGKIPAEDYPAQRKELLQSGADVLRRIDALTTAHSPDRRVEPAESCSEVTAAARRPREEKKPASSSASDDDLEDLIARRRAARKEKSSGFCPKCGKPILKSDVYCPSCGFALQ